MLFVLSKSGLQTALKQNKILKGQELNVTQTLQPH